MLGLVARGALGEHAYGGHVKGSTPPHNAPNLNDDGISIKYNL